MLGEKAFCDSEPEETLDVELRLAEISGEDKDILFTKEANREQLQIAKRIEKYDPVVVQGPPGTGKTHTIANLLGHFLAHGKNVLVTSHTRKALSVVKEKVVPELQHLCVSVLEDNNRDMEKSVDGITEYISSHTLIELAENIDKYKKQREQIMSELAEVRKRLFAIRHKEYETIIFGGKGYSVAEAARFVKENQEKLSYLPGKVSLYKPLPVSRSELELLYRTNAEISINEEMELEYQLPNPADLIEPSEFEQLVSKEKDLIDMLKQFQKEFGRRLKIDSENCNISVDGEPLCFSIDWPKLEMLEDELLAGNKEELERWQLSTILAGKQGGGYRAVWENLIDEITDTYNFSRDIAPLVVGKQLLSCKPVDQNTIHILTEIKQYLSKGKKLSSFVLLFRKDWKELLNDVTINGNKIATSNDCMASIALAELMLKRKGISELWAELIEKHGGPAFAEFGEQPEQGCVSYVATIRYYLNWYNDVYQNIKNKMVESGLNPCLIDGNKQYISPIEEIKDTVHVVYRMLPQYIALAKIAYLELPKIRHKIESFLKVLRSPNLKDSSVCLKLIVTLKQRDVISYRKNFMDYKQLYAKYYYQSERERILKSIEQDAPEWAALIRKRVGIHGDSKVPDNIEEAWKWKQFAGIIEEITAEPYEELQKKSVFLTNELRKITAKLAENMAWYHLLKRLEGDIRKKQALQGWKLTTKKIGKGTGKTAPKLKREAQKLMAECQTAVPAWIMTVNKALETLDPAKNKFDIVIIDEASQSDISALAILYLAKKVIIVGDDEQVSPSAVGIDVDKMANLANMYIKGVIPNAHLYDMKSSLYDIAKTTFPTLMLKEHFRCVPSIIGYSNRLSYDCKIKPLRDDSHAILKPATIAFRVDGKRDNRKTNEVEAQTIIALMLACMEQKEYDGMTFGAISLLGDAQAQLLNKIAIDKIQPKDMESRRILCGNASHFQGDERDVIFISLVDSNEGDGPLRLTSHGAGDSMKQRYNVAVSRAKNQLWVVHSLDIHRDLKPGDMRRDLIEYVMNPETFAEQLNQIEAKADSPFEVSVAKALVSRGYDIEQQWQVGSYRIDIVVKYQDKKIAIECDGDRYHSGEEKIREDMERQAILERLGWRFIRIRGSEYYRYPEETMERVIKQLSEYGIEPQQGAKIVTLINNSDTELKQRVIATATKILHEWSK